MIWSAADLRALEGIRVGHFEVVYAFMSLEGEPSVLDEALLDDEELAPIEALRPTARPPSLRPAPMRALRLFLARCLGVDPATVRYETGVHGKPRLLPGLPPLEFNLSHSEGLGLLAVARDRSVGVDIECIPRHARRTGTSPRTYFSVAEREALRSLPLAEQESGVLLLLDAQGSCDQGCRGEGLSRALDSFEVDIAPGSVSALKSLDDHLGRKPRWSLRDLPAPFGYAAAGPSRLLQVSADCGENCR